MNIAAGIKQSRPGIVGVGVSYASDPAVAVQEAVAQLDRSNIRFVLVFIPDGLDPPAVAAALGHWLPKTSIFGCTTAGQITPRGYENNAILIVAFPRNHFRYASALIKPLNPVAIEQTAVEMQKLDARFQRTANWNRFALMFADGLSKQEDVLVAALEAGLGDIPFFGGSAGNGLAFKETFVLHGGEIHTDAALVILLETDLEFEGVGFDHFLPTAQQMVVTRAIPEERIVLEINGSLAAEEYARLVGCRVDDLSPRVFAENPVLVRNHNVWHVRAIQQVIDGTSLSFFSAIDNGLLLTLGRGKEILRTLDSELTLTNSRGDLPDFILGFDCVLRKLEIEQKNLGPAVSEILQRHHVLGFNTYGEQHLGVHVSQTFVGVGFYPPARGIHA